VFACYVTQKREAREAKEAEKLSKLVAKVGGLGLIYFIRVPCAETL
jgi:hypothetical protein